MFLATLMGGKRRNCPFQNALSFIVTETRGIYKGQKRKQNMSGRGKEGRRGGERRRYK